MKKNIETGAKVITFLASCGEDEVEIEDLLGAVIEGFTLGDNVDEAYGMVRSTLKELAAEDMVSLSGETVPLASTVPGVIRIRPKMRKPAERLIRGKPPVKVESHQCELAELQIHPELLGQIEAILKEDEEKNGEIKGWKTRRKNLEG
jgi:hypothetical protein